MEWNPVYKQSDLDKMIESRCIKSEVNLRGEYNISLDGVDCIMGSLSISNSTIKSLYTLKEINGDFYIYQSTVKSWLTSLENLEKVDGNLTLSGSNISNLGNLTYIGGSLNLRNLNIENLGKVAFIGNNLFLPKRLKGKLDFSNIVIGGSIRYYKDKTNLPILSFNPKKRGLTKFDGIVPEWSGKNPYGIPDWSHVKDKQSSFYALFKKKFLSNEYIDISGDRIYAFILMYDFYNEFEQDKNFDKLKQLFNILSKYYTYTKLHANSFINSIIQERSNQDIDVLVSSYKKNGDFKKFVTKIKILIEEHKSIIPEYYASNKGNACNRIVDIIEDELKETKDPISFITKIEYLHTYLPLSKSEKWHHDNRNIDILENARAYKESWKYMNNVEYHSRGLLMYIYYERKLKKKLLNGMSILTEFSYALSSLGYEKKDRIVPYMNKELKLFEEKYRKRFFDIFFKNLSTFKFRKTFSETPFLENHFDKYPIKYYRQFYTDDDKYASVLNERKSNKRSGRYAYEGLLNQCSIMVEQAENAFRIDNGLKKRGEEWVSETILYYKVKELYTSYTVIQHAKLSWLGSQHLDIYIKELNIGLEYQGAQHYVPVEFFGGKEALIRTKERDERKKQKCKKNNCELIIVNEDYDFSNITVIIDTIIKKTTTS